MRVAKGNGLAKIVAEERADAAAVRARPRADRRREARIPGATRSIVLAARHRSRRSPSSRSSSGSSGASSRTGYDREYEQEPPTDTQPALVPTLLRQGGEAGSFEFTATLFDLIRRGVYTSKPGHDRAHRSGAGCGTRTVSDLELSHGKPDAS